MYRLKMKMNERKKLTLYMTKMGDQLACIDIRYVFDTLKETSKFFEK